MPRGHNEPRSTSPQLPPAPAGNVEHNVRDGGADNDTPIGAAGSDSLVFASAFDGAESMTDLSSGTDHFVFRGSYFSSLSSIGDRDHVIDSGVTVTGPRGFTASSGLVIVTANIAGAITTATAGHCGAAELAASRAPPGGGTHAQQGAECGPAAICVIVHILVGAAKHPVDVRRIALGEA